MSDDKRALSGRTNSPDNDELIYDTIQGGDVPVHRHDVVIPGDASRQLEQPEFATAPPPSSSDGVNLATTPENDLSDKAVEQEQTAAPTTGGRSSASDTPEGRSSTAVQSGDDTTEDTPPESLVVQDGLAVEPLATPIPQDSSSNEQVSQPPAAPVTATVTDGGVTTVTPEPDVNLGGVEAGPVPDEPAQAGAQVSVWVRGVDAGTT